jgi:hypothetical protein
MLISIMIASASIADWAGIVTALITAVGIGVLAFEARRLVRSEARAELQRSLDYQLTTFNSYMSLYSLAFQSEAGAFAAVRDDPTGAHYKKLAGAESYHAMLGASALADFFDFIMRSESDDMWPGGMESWFTHFIPQGLESSWMVPDVPQTTSSPRTAAARGTRNRTSE